ncbi:zinc finger MYM-type protein 4-like [Brachionichthys hirsutus]|uniref:zinc finger MYM-type protein 4-like n=1 Tax=Brachionichthys hirsutus TaxID=412623 RepID=UPI00360537D6
MTLGWAQVLLYCFSGTRSPGERIASGAVNKWAGQRVYPNQDISESLPSVICSHAAGGTDGEPAAPEDAGGSEPVHSASAKPCEHGVEDDVAPAAAKVTADAETKPRETEAEVDSSVSHLNLSPAQSSTSPEDTVKSVLGQLPEPEGVPESEKKDTEEKTDEDFEVNKDNLAVKENRSGQSSTGTIATENTEVNEICHRKKEPTEADAIKDPGMETEEKMESLTSNLRVPTADALDEMMDIGTVDQVDQEAQMKEEEQNGSMDVGCSLLTTTISENTESIVEDTEVKTSVVPAPADEDRVEDKNTSDLRRSGSPPSSEALPDAENEGSSSASMVNGESSELKSSPSPLPVKVKEEPADDEYEQAQVSSAVSTANVKDEPNTAKEELRIGSVYSVSPATEQSLPVVSSSLPMFCSNCKKNLLKGQTAFQRKGSPALFCSTSCLTTMLPSVKRPAKICHYCQKAVFRPQEIILVADAKGAIKEFCSKNCLTGFNCKNNVTNKLPPQSACSMCTKHCISKHEVFLNTTTHKICSDACFKRFRTVNNLSLAGCANCEVFCHHKSIMLKLQGGSRPLCNAECLSKYKAKTKVTEPCTMCRTARVLAEMIDNKNADNSVSLFCGSSCVMAYMVQTVSASGARINCDSCGKNALPAYHLAMSDTSIRNFCTLPCVMAFQDKFKKSQNQMNVFTKLPIGSTQIQGITPVPPPRDVSKEAQKLSCSQCNQSITVKPVVVQIKDKMAFMCSMNCSYEFKKAKSITGLCEYCKMEKIPTDVKRINNKDCFFCGDSCKLLFEHDMTENWGKHCNSCAYCHSASKRLVTAQYGGSTEEFCSDECRSKYTMLFCHVAKCDTCGQKGKLKQSLMLEETKNFCELTCMLQFCCDTVDTQGEVFHDLGEATPVIANVISLADSESHAADETTEQSTDNCESKSKGHIGCQTDAVKTNPPSGQKILKNKAVLCRPLVQSKGVSCKTRTADRDSQTDDSFPQVMIVPIPVPVYVPVPMNMYTQCAPNPMALPVPVPVPMFLPVTVDSAERIVQTIQEIKEKIPSDPFEAELILMAEMVAEQDEMNHKEERLKEKEREKQAAVPDDHASNYSDLDTDDLATFLNNWEDASSDTVVRSPGQRCSQEKLNPSLDSPVDTSSEHSSEVPPPPMDIETDIPIETLEKLAQLREQSQKSQSPQHTSQRRQAPRKAREKRAQKSQRSSKAAKVSSQRHSLNKAKVVDVPKLKSQYGVDAWKRWILWRRAQHGMEKTRFARSMETKDDVLRCTTAELSYGLCCFINEVERPNGEPYSPDSLFYLCLGIQQHLFENGRVENIFMDRFYNKFSTEFTTMLRSFKPLITAGGEPTHSSPPAGYVHSRVEEEFLWDCKQLGAYSPIVLLNTLIFFCCKHFGFTTIEQHRQLSFAHVMRCTRTNQDQSKTAFLRFYPPLSINETESGPEVPAKRRREEENKEDILEMMENTENPLRCPVRLYEFYLSKCSESVKQRTNVFYLHPERCCVPNSPLWFSSTPLDDATIEAMLTRIMIIRERASCTRKGETEQDPSEDEDSE